MFGRRSSRSDRRLATLLALGALTAFAVALVGVRVFYTGTPVYGNLVWNLFLAWIPFVVALLVCDGFRWGAPRPALVAGAAVWLLFLPNAPYLVTDLKLLREWGGAPIWFDIVLVSTAAWTGLLLGFASLSLMHSVGRRIVGTLAAWLLVLAVLALTSFGVFLGRFQRWNSWDVVTRPRLLLGELLERGADPLGQGRAVAATVLFTVFLTLTYAVFHSLVRVGAGAEERRS